MYKKYEIKNGEKITRKDLLGILGWCKKKLGRSKYYSIRKLQIKFQSNLKYFVGVYDVERNTIFVNPSKVRNYLDLIATIIHEYVHFKQNQNTYENIDMILPRNRNYYDHPFEKEAEDTAQKLKKKCLKELIDEGIISRS